MSKKDCLIADWQREGYSAGFDGEADSAAAFEKRAEICAKYGQPADRQAFVLGHAEGMDRFCEIPNAVKLGERGARRVITNQICPEQDNIGFETAFNAGYRLHLLRGRAINAQQEYDRLQQQEYRYRRNIDVLRQQINSSESTDQQKQSASHSLNRIRRDLNYLRSSMYRYRDDVIRHQHAADSYEGMLDLEYGENR